MSANKIGIGLPLLLITQLSLQAQVKENLLLNGAISGLKTGDKVFLISKDQDTLASAVAVDSTFSIKIRIEGEANFYFLRFSSSVQPLVSQSWSNAMWLENMPIQVAGMLSDIKNLTIVGSPLQNEYLAAKQLWNNTSDSLRINTAKAFISQHLNSPFIPYFILQLNKTLYLPGELDSVIASLGTRAKNSLYGRELILENSSEKVIQGTFKEGLIGAKIPDYKITMRSGNPQSIYDVIGKNQYTLIDYWASWCGPCKEAIPELKMLYKQYKQNGFEILGISMDERESAWTAALSKEQTPWTHGIDNLESAHKNIWRLMAIPGYILVNKEGEILAADLISTIPSGPKASTDNARIRDSLLVKISNIISAK